MHLIINNSSMQPIYEQIVGQIKEKIQHGELQQEEALPSVRTLSRELRISALTVKKAYDALEQEGFIVSQVGIGTFVSTSNLELLRDSKRRLVEQKMADMIQTAKSLKISKEELNSMMYILYEED